MLKDISKYVLVALALVIISIFVAALGYFPAAIYMAVLAVVFMQAGEREE